MTISKVRTAFNCDIKRVWDIVTSLENYSWRSDLSKIEVINDKHFIEYTKDGYATNFTVTAFVPLERWEFDMENDNMKGRWTGVFSSVKDGITEVEFTEKVEAKKLIMKPFVKGYLKKQQTNYIADLKKGLKL